TARGRAVSRSVGAVASGGVLGTTEEIDRELLSVHLRADSRFADGLSCAYPTSAEMPRVTTRKIEEGFQYPRMNGRNVFKHASVHMPAVVQEALAANQLAPSDIKCLIPHQANLRISEMVQARLGLRDDQVFNNIQRYGNTTA